MPVVDELLVAELTPLQEEQFENEDSLADGYIESVAENFVTRHEPRLSTHPYDLEIKYLQEQIDGKTLVLADDFQRRQLWDDAKASRLIESLLIGVPIPTCYFAEMPDNSFSVVDGQQRITVIYRYLNNQFPLKSLQIRKDLNGRKADQIGVVDKRIIRTRSLSCVVILNRSDPKVRFDVFDRLTANSASLNRQELRASLYRGNLNNLIKSLSGDKTFQRIRQVDDVDKRMKDCELILRFFALVYNYGSYRGVLAPFLDCYLREGQDFSPEKIAQHHQLFIDTIDKVQCVFAENSFRRYVLSTENWHPVVNRAIYDVTMLYFSRMSLTWVQNHRQELLENFQDACEDAKFKEAISSIVETIPKIQQRLDCWYQRLQSIGCAVERIVVEQQ